MTKKIEPKCPICGKPTSVWYGNARKDGLCREHAQMLKDGKLIQCPDCGSFHLANEECKCKRNINSSEEKKNEGKINKSCLFCGKETENGNLFCKEHYYKYKDKNVTVIIKNLKEFVVIDEYGNRDVKTANGMYVRSQQEKIIYDELYYRNIKCEYEKSFFYKDEKGETKELHPDFYLPDYDLYIEHWGYENTKDPRYIEKKQYTQNIYKKHGIKLAGTTAEDIKDIKRAIDKIFFDFNINLK